MPREVVPKSLAMESPLFTHVFQKFYPASLFVVFDEVVKSLSDERISIGDSTWEGKQGEWFECWNWK